MTVRVDFHVLEVGQGMCNFVAIYNRDDNEAENLVTTLLFDAGSQKGDTEPGTRASIRYIVDVLTDMAEAADDGIARMGALVLSHSDSDHINLLPRIFENFDPPSAMDPTKKVLAIDYIFFSGDPDKYDKTHNKRGGDDNLNIACQYLLGPVEDHCLGFGYNETDVRDDPGDWLPTYRYQFNSTPGSTSGSTSSSGSDAQGHSVSIYVVTVNTADGYGTEDYDQRLPGVSNVNTGCLVTLLQVEGDGEPLRILVSGDATAEAMTRCYLNVMRSSDPLNVFHLTLPHHGSGFTTFNLNADTMQSMIDDETSSDIALLGKRVVSHAAHENLVEFVRAMGARSVSASAGSRNSFNHPEALVLRYFAQALDEGEAYYSDPDLGPARHFITASFEEDLCEEHKLGSKVHRPWPPEEGWGVVQTVANIFTTQYVLPTNKEEKKLEGRRKDLDGSQRVVLRNLLPKGVLLVTRDRVDPGRSSPQGVNWIFTLVRRADGSGTSRVGRREHSDDMMEVSPSVSRSVERYSRMASLPAPRSAEPVSLLERPMRSLMRIG